MIVTLKDGSKKEYAEAKSVIDIAYDISEGLARAACAGEVNGEVVDLRTVIDSDCELNILTAKDEKGLAVLRHTASHVLAQAVQTLFPDAKVAIGPSIDTGFYYDFDCPPFSRDDLDAIEKEMKKIIKKGAKIERFTKSREDAIAYFQEKNEPYKVELIEDLPEGSEISFYSQGDWTDLCAGPHLMSVKGVKAFKLLSSSSAYWRGSEKNAMLTRIYGTAYASKDELKEHLEQMEEAKRRDHNKLGREMKIFTTVDVIGQGLPLIMPNGVMHRCYRFLQHDTVVIDIIYMENEREIKDALIEKWKNHNHMVKKMIEIVKKYGLDSANKTERLERKMGVEGTREERTVRGKHYEAVYGDCVEETRAMESNSVDLIHTSIPFGNHYEYSANYNDFGHNQDTERFFEQMNFLTPELLRVLKPGRVAAIHVKDRVLFGNATGTGMPTIEPFHADCIEHYMRHGFQYFGMITVVTDVVRENNQTYRLGWTEQCKDGTKMGVGCPEYILLFRKLPTDHSKAYADDPVTKSKDEYTRAQWQIDAHGYWRSSGDRLISKEELEGVSVDNLQRVYRQYSREHVYNYEEHVALAKYLDTDGRLPATFMVVAPGSWNQLEVWDDINRMRTLNTTQSRRRATMHVCPLQLDIVERIINRYSNPGDVVYDPFGGLMTVPMMAVKMHRFGKGCELNPDYFRDGVGYLQSEENEVDSPTLFDFLEVGDE